jgi:hypothetical protein
MTKSFEKSLIGVALVALVAGGGITPAKAVVTITGPIAKKDCATECIPEKCLNDPKQRGRCDQDCSYESLTLYNCHPKPKTRSEVESEKKAAAEAKTTTEVQGIAGKFFQKK